MRKGKAKPAKAAPARKRKKRIAATPLAANRLIDERLGTLQVRLAETWDEVDAALALRYRVFFDEMKARASPGIVAKQRDVDEFDPYCDHLLVIDTALGTGPEAVVGTYRMLRRQGAAKVGRFYSSAEYDLQPIIDHPGEILEMGRSCVESRHRTRAAMQLLWRGVTAYVLANRIDILFGCASLHGTDPTEMAAPLSYLYHNHLAPPDMRPVALPSRYVGMNLLPKEAIDAKAAMRDLPPMIKGYLRLAGVVGDGAVIDHDFNTVDVFVYVDMRKVTEKYFKHYTRGIKSEGGEA
ncbi:MAG: GNAT family N-acetyltransferase [Rhodospirillaceae bacterium]|nr:GNAT family N-acetyltransferase [Rhodospirillaceae bacterium]